MDQDDVHGYLQPIFEESSEVCLRADPFGEGRLRLGQHRHVNVTAVVSLVAGSGAEQVHCFHGWTRRRQRFGRGGQASQFERRPWPGAPRFLFVSSHQSLLLSPFPRPYRPRKPRAIGISIRRPRSHGLHRSRPSAPGAPGLIVEPVPAHNKRDVRLLGERLGEDKET